MNVDEHGTALSREQQRNQFSGESFISLGQKKLPRSKKVVVSSSCLWRSGWRQFFETAFWNQNILGLPEFQIPDSYFFLN
jgi:hypothetical protein